MQSILYRKPLLFLIFAAILFCTMPINAGGYSDDHNNGTLDSWTVFGDKVWSESGGYAYGQNSNNKGFLIKDNNCANDGTFIFKIEASPHFARNGGGIFRYSDTTHYYYVYIFDENANGTSTDNALIFCKNRLDKSGSYTIVKDNLDLSGMNSKYTIKVELSGSTFTFWWYNSNTWDSLGQVTDYEHSSGKVGYAVNTEYTPLVWFDFSSWEDVGSGGGGGGDTVTVNAGGGGDYTSLNSALIDIHNNIITPDVVYFNGSQQYTYEMSEFFESSLYSIAFIGAETDPDNFPIINHTNYDYYQAMKNVNITFENLILTGTTGFKEDNGSNEIIFRNCIIQNHSGNEFIYLQANDNAHSALFENCLFINNTCNNIFSISYYGTAHPNFQIINCTFDNNTSIFSYDEDNNNNMNFFNNIFSGNGTTFRGDRMRSKTRYSLTSESLSGYGTGCVSNSSPQYVSSSRSEPSDWIISYTSPATGIGTSTDAPDYDLGGNSRLGDIDAGCWVNESLFEDNYTWDISESGGIQTGNGTWGTDNYWTPEGEGTVLVAWPGAGRSAVFAGSDGSYTITVNGQQYVDSIAFMNDGYTIESDTIYLDGEKAIYVDSGKTATINTKIKGSNGLSKYGSGKLILGGVNEYSGKTTVDSGTLQVGNGTQGSITIFDSIVNNASLIYNIPDVEYGQFGVISGTGTLAKMGPGTLTVAGSNTFTGDVTISSGEIRIGQNGTYGSISADVINNSRFCINRSDDYTFSNVISGTGKLVKWGDGKLILTGNNTYTGITEISTGTLQIGNGGTSGSIAGNITNDQTLYFNRSDSYTYDGAISGTGSVTQDGSGTVILGGDNTYTGVTTINSGTLQIGNGGTTGSISNSSSITNNSALIIDRYDSYSYSGVISGSGTLTKEGEGTVTLSGANTFSGNTTISEGTLNITGSLATESSVTINSGGILSGTGTVNGSVSASGGTVAPGDDGAGTLTAGSLTLNSSSTIDFELGSSKDSLKVNGDLVLDGTLKITETAGFTTGSYTLINYTGTLTDNELEVDAVAGIYTYSIEAGDNEVILNVEESNGLLPITVDENTGSGTTDMCLIYTDNWSILFEESIGGQINFLSNQSAGVGTNQVWQTDSRNLFSVSFGENSYDISGELELIEKSSFHAVLHNRYTLSDISFLEEYTVYGSGQMFIKVTAVNNCGSSRTQALQFMSVRTDLGNSIRKTKTSTASNCPYLLNAESSADQIDILLAVKELWDDATGFVNSSGNNSVLGYEASSYTFTDGMCRTWEFMIVFSKESVSDTSIVTNNIADNFIAPDTLEFITGTVAMERAWEHYLRGHWRLDDQSGDTARDYSGNNRHSLTSGTWDDGKWDGGISLTSEQKITLPHESDFDGKWHFTAMAWIKTSALDANSIIIGKHNGSQGWKLTGNSSDQVTLTLDNTVISGKTNVADNTWHHVAAAFSTKKDTVKIYVDGRVDTVAGGLYTVSQNASAIDMGDGFTGILDDIRYYSEEVSENTLKAIYQLGYRSSSGLYQLRADNNNMVHFEIDGGTVPRYFPIFKIENYWAESKPQAGCVKLNGSSLTENSDYYVYFHDARNELTLGFNQIINKDETVFYIDDSYGDGDKREGPVKKMSWGVDSGGDGNYVWVKNFEDSSFGSSISNQWYINWNMSTSGSAHQHRDGEIWYMASSVEKAYEEIDTTSSSLIPGDEISVYYSTMGQITFLMDGSYYVRTTECVQNSFSYAFEESTVVRIRLRINERNVSVDGRGYDIVTNWTLYSSGQMFRYDSIYNFSTTPTAFYNAWYMGDQTNATIHTDKQNKRAGVIYSSGYPDYAVAWLSMKNDDGYQSEPFDSDTIRTEKNEYRVGFDFNDNSLPSIWNSTSIETAVYIDLQHTSMSTASIDSFGNGVQHIGIKGSDALLMLSGTLDTTTRGDLNEDGFNEAEGAYIISAENNTVNFKLPAEADTCRFYPALRITDYFASSKPLYVILYKGADTVSILEEYQYSAYHNKVDHELVMQIDSVFCDTVGIYISADKTLAVQMSGFWGNGGSGCDTLFWRTESEQDNLGFMIYRRIKPSFYDSVYSQFVLANNSADSDFFDLIKKEQLKAKDTIWTQINEKMVPGSPSGVSYGTRSYKYLDFNVINKIIYEYKLVAIDYNSSTEEFGPVELMPFKKIPQVFKLHNNYPNPFRKKTILKFELPQEMRISMNIYDIGGRLVRRLILPDKLLEATYHQVIWDGLDKRGNNLSAGPYIYRVSSKKYVKARMMIKLE